MELSTATIYTINNFLLNVRNPIKIKYPSILFLSILHAPYRCEDSNMIHFGLFTTRFINDLLFSFLSYYRAMVTQTAAYPKRNIKNPRLIQLFFFIYIHVVRHEDTLPVVQPLFIFLLFKKSMFSFNDERNVHYVLVNCPYRIVQKQLA